MSTIEEEHYCEANQQMADAEHKSQAEPEGQKIQVEEAREQTEDDVEQHKAVEETSKAPAAEPKSEDTKTESDEITAIKPEDSGKPDITADPQTSELIKPAESEVVASSPKATEAQEPVSSSSARVRISSRRPSHPKSSRNYPGNFQNYGLTYLPYKSNFEPSDEARRRADEFFKTLKL